MRDPKLFEYWFTRVVIWLVVIAIGFLGSRIIGNLYYNHLMKLNEPIQDFRKNYQEQINQENDPFKLAKFGRVLLKTGSLDLAWRAFSKTTELDAGWRDGWVARGFAELKLNKTKEALDSLKIAEKIDPINPLTYELLSVVYERIGDAKSSQFAREKFEYLNKSP